MNFKFMLQILCIFEVFENVFAHLSLVENMNESEKKKEEVRFAEDNILHELHVRRTKASKLKKKRLTPLAKLERITGLQYDDIVPKRDIVTEETKTLWNQAEKLMETIRDLMKEKTCHIPVEADSICERAFQNKSFFKREKLSYPGEKRKNQCQNWVLKTWERNRRREYDLEFKKCFATRHSEDGSQSSSFIVYLKSSSYKTWLVIPNIFIIFAYEKDPINGEWKLKGDDIPEKALEDESVTFRFEALLPV